MSDDSNIRHPIVNGIFYPGEAAELKRLIYDLMDAAVLQEYAIALPQDMLLKALVVPHASYQHAGGYIARAFDKSPEMQSITRVVIISTVHRDFEEAVWVPGYEAFKTPMGDLPLDVQMTKTLIEHGNPFHENNLPYAEEHSQEIILPFIQHCMPQVKILPLMLGKNSRKLVQAAAQVLEHTEIASDASTLFIVSTNLSSFTDSVNAQKEAEHIISQFEKPVPSFLSPHSSNVCGSGGLELLNTLFSTPLTYYKLSVGRSGIIQPEQREVWYGSYLGYIPPHNKTTN